MPIDYSMRKRIELKIHGNVQGVFFRTNIEAKAKELGLTGWVRNEQDGTVLVIAEGEEKDLQKLVNFCYNGVQSARVDKIDEKWQDYKGGFKCFEIKFS